MTMMFDDFLKIIFIIIVIFFYINKVTHTLRSTFQVRALGAVWFVPVLSSASHILFVFLRSSAVGAPKSLA